MPVREPHQFEGTSETGIYGTNTSLSPSAHRNGRTRGPILWGRWCSDHARLRRLEETLAEKVLSFLRRHAQHRSGNMEQEWDEALVLQIASVTVRGGKTVSDTLFVLFQPGVQTIPVGLLVK
jgi:hypothetical protein